MFLAIGLIVLSIILLYFGAEFALGASEIIGKKLKLSPLVIGMVLIGLGTSLPEFFVAHIAVASSKPTMAIGALVGSNIANMLLILGVAGLFTRLSLSSKSLKSQLIVHFLLCLAVTYVLFRGSIDLISSSILICVCFIYIKLIFNDIKNYQVEVQEVTNSSFVTTMKLVVGFILLYIGGEFLVKGGTDLCLILGVSEYIVSSIFIAFGTSFPELVTVLLSVVKKKDSDLIVGNIIGSNLFNCSLILATLGFYDFKLVQNFDVESAVLILGGLVLLFGAIFKKDFFRLYSIFYLVLYSLIVLFWSGIITRSNLWI